MNERVSKCEYTRIRERKRPTFGVKAPPLHPITHTHSRTKERKKRKAGNKK